jgi:hypothetical protein
LIQAGIVELVYDDGSFQALAAERDITLRMCKEAGLIVRQYAG